MNYYGYQPNLDRINRQIEELTNIKNQMQNNPQPVIQQTFMQPSFQSDFDAKWIDNKEQINNIPVTRDSIFMSKNDAIFYIKNTSGEIKAYTFTEYIEKDEKDLKIENLEKQIQELKKEMSKNESVIQKSKSSKSVVNDTEV